MKSIKQLKKIKNMIEGGIVFSIAALICFGVIGNKILCSVTLLLISVLLLMRYKLLRQKLKIVCKELTNILHKKMKRYKFNVALTERKNFFVVEVNVKETLTTEQYNCFYNVAIDYLETVEVFVGKGSMLELQAERIK